MRNDRFWIAEAPITIAPVKAPTANAQAATFIAKIFAGGRYVD